MILSLRLTGETEAYIIVHGTARREVQYLKTFLKNTAIGFVGGFILFWLYWAVALFTYNRTQAPWVIDCLLDFLMIAAAVLPIIILLVKNQSILELLFRFLGIIIAQIFSSFLYFNFASELDHLFNITESEINGNVAGLFYVLFLGGILCSSAFALVIQIIRVIVRKKKSNAA